MQTLRNYAISLATTTFLMLAPVAHAQSADELETMQTFLDIMTSYFAIIQSTHDISSDVEKSAIMQMQKIQEVYEERGEKSAVAEILREVLRDSHNPTIRNSAYMMLGDVLKESGRTDDAIEILRRGLSENIEAAK